MSDIYMWIMLLIMFTLVVVLDTGIVHLVWWRKCKKEQGQHRFGGTSNNQEEFNMKVFQIRKHFWNYTILGLGMETPPKRGDVLYLIQKEFVTTVLVKKIMTEIIPNKDYYRVELCTFRHIPKRIRKNKESILTDVFMSNLRAKDQVEPQKHCDVGSIQYPLMIRHSMRTLLSNIFIILVGFGELFWAILALFFEDTPSWGIGLFFMVLGLLFIICGMVSFWQDYNYMIQVEANGCVHIRYKGIIADVTLDTISWGFKLTNNKPEHRTMVLSAEDGTLLGELADTEKGFEPLLALLRENLREKNRQELIQSIREKKWMLPLIDGKPITEEIKNDIEGKEPGTALVITDSPVHLKNFNEDHRFRDISLEEAVEMTKGLTVYQEIWLLLELPSNGRTRSYRYVLASDNLEAVLGKDNS